ncbi:hypothetical protein DMENIID0001_135110 [Sergentomyia squamirostris]
MSYLSCCVKGCQYRGKRRVPFNVSLFTLPANAPDALKRAWREVCVGRIIACSEHFAPEDYVMRKRVAAPGQMPTLMKTLRHNVVPKRTLENQEKEKGESSSKFSDENPKEGTDKKSVSKRCESPKDPLALDDDDTVVISEDESDMNTTKTKTTEKTEKTEKTQEKSEKIPPENIQSTNISQMRPSVGKTITITQKKLILNSLTKSAENVQKPSNGSSSNSPLIQGTKILLNRAVNQKTYGSQVTLKEKDEQSPTPNSLDKSANQKDVSSLQAKPGPNQPKIAEVNPKKKPLIKILPKPGPSELKTSEMNSQTIPALKILNPQPKPGPSQQKGPDIISDEIPPLQLIPRPKTGLNQQKNSEINTQKKPEPKIVLKPEINQQKVLELNSQVIPALKVLHPQPKSEPNNHQILEMNPQKESSEISSKIPTPDLPNDTILLDSDDEEQTLPTTHIMIQPKTAQPKAPSGHNLVMKIVDNRKVVINDSDIPKLKVNVNCPLRVTSVESLKSGVKYLVKPRQTSAEKGNSVENPQEIRKTQPDTVSEVEELLKEYRSANEIDVRVQGVSNNARNAEASKSQNDTDQSTRGPQKSSEQMRVARQKFGESLSTLGHRKFMVKESALKENPSKGVYFKNFLSGKAVTIKKVTPKRKDVDNTTSEVSSKIRKLDESSSSSSGVVAPSNDITSPFMITSVRSLSAATELPAQQPQTTSVPTPTVSRNAAQEPCGHSQSKKLVKNHRKQDVSVAVNSPADSSFHTSFTVQINPDMVFGTVLSKEIQAKQITFEEIPLENALRELSTSIVSAVAQQPAPSAISAAVAATSKVSSQPTTSKEPSPEQENDDDDDVIILPEKIDVIEVDGDSDTETTSETEAQRAQESSTSDGCDLQNCMHFQQLCEAQEKKRQLILTKKKLADQKAALDIIYNKKLIKYESSKAFLESIPNIMSKNQMDLFLGTKSKVVWHQKEIQDALVLKHLSEEFYLYLRDKLRYPLPSLTSLDKWEREYVLQARYIKEYAIDYQHNQNEDMDEDEEATKN